MPNRQYTRPWRFRSLKPRKNRVSPYVLDKVLGHQGVGSKGLPSLKHKPRE